MTTSAAIQTTRPRWATFVAVGFFIAGFGAIILAIGFLTGALTIIGPGAAGVAVGAAVSMFGGYGYFIRS